MVLLLKYLSYLPIRVKPPSIRGLTAFIVRRGTPGFTVGKAENKMGIRASNTTELIFPGLLRAGRKPSGTEGHGFRIAMETLDAARPFVDLYSSVLPKRHSVPAANMQRYVYSLKAHCFL